MAGRRIRTDLGTVQATLADVAHLGLNQAARKHGLVLQTVIKWRRRQEREPAGWPTDADVATWRAETALQVQRRGVWADPTGTRRRLQALRANGWTAADLAARLGFTPGGVYRLASQVYGPAAVHRDTVAKVRALYTSLEMRVPAHRPQWQIDRLRRLAARRGWAPPLAWASAEAMDYPAASPHPEWWAREELAG